MMKTNAVYKRFLFNTAGFFKYPLDLKCFCAGLMSGLFLILFFCMWGCSHQPAAVKEDPYTKWKMTAKTAKGHSPSPKQRRTRIDSEVTSSKDFETQSSTVEMVRPLPTVMTSLKMHNADITAVLKAMARSADQNILISESVSGRVNVNITKAPWDQVFISLLNSQGLTYVWEGDIIRIVTVEDKNKWLMQLEVDEKIKSKKKELEMVESLITKVVRVDFSDAVKLKVHLEKFLSKKGEEKVLGAVMVDEHSNSLIIQAIRSDMERLLALVDELDQPTRQVLIEAHIVETNQETARQLGVQWGGLYHKTGGNNYWIAPGAGGAVGVTPESGQTVNPASGYAVNFPAMLKDSVGMSIGYISEKAGESILAAQLTALQQKGELKILSNPSITTLDNQPAKIESGKEVPFQTVENGEVSITFKKAVLSLDVTPHVVGSKSLKLKIVTHKDELDFTNTVAGNPTIITKNAETNVVLFDGQTTVIGGLNKETATSSESGVPWLKDIPILGYLFKGNSNDKTLEEVLIFITPHILGKQS